MHSSKVIEKFYLNQILLNFFVIDFTVSLINYMISINEAKY
jgi:hypothetical protein